MSKLKKQQSPIDFFFMNKDAIQYQADYGFTIKEIQTMYRSIGVPLTMSYPSFAKLFRHYISTPHRKHTPKLHRRASQKHTHEDTKTTQEKDKEDTRVPYNTRLHIDLSDSEQTQLALQLGAQEGHLRDGRSCLMIPAGMDIVPFRKAGLIETKST